MTQTLNKAQLICINTLISKLGLMEQKPAMVAGFSSGRTERSSKLSPEEAADMIRHLKSLDPDEQKAERQRRKIISMAHEMGWRIPGTNRADMIRLDAWCQKYGIFKKKLNAHCLKELPALVTQFETVYKSFLNGL